VFGLDYLIYVYVFVVLMCLYAVSYIFIVVYKCLLFVCLTSEKTTIIIATIKNLLLLNLD